MATAVGTNKYIHLINSHYYALKHTSISHSVVFKLIELSLNTEKYYQKSEQFSVNSNYVCTKGVGIIPGT